MKIIKTIQKNMMERLIQSKNDPLQLNYSNKLREKFRDGLKDTDFVELINGKVVNLKPFMLREINISQNLMMLLSSFVRFKDMGEVFSGSIMTSFSRNDYMPDIKYYTKEIVETFDDDQLFFPPPQLIVEVLSPSTEKNDRGVKFQDYEAHGVEEYWIVDPDKEAVEQYLLIDDNYELQKNSEIINSKVIKGLKLPIKAIFNEKEGQKFIKQMF